MKRNEEKNIDGTSFDLLVDVVGMRIAWKLCENFSGNDLRFCNGVESFTAHNIIKVMGEEDAQKVFDAFPSSEKIYIPKQPLGGKKRIHATLLYIKKRVSEGASTREIASELKVTPRTVRSYRKKLGMNLPLSGRERGKRYSKSNSNAPLTHHTSEKCTNTPKPNKNAS